MKPLDGKVAVVTGAGRERGIGRATAVALAKWGADVVVTDLARPVPGTEWAGRTTVADDMLGLEALAAEVNSLGSVGLPLAVDVTNREEVQDCVNETVEVLGGIDILFNNAGTPAGIGPFLETPDSVWEKSWQVNVMGMVNCCQAVIPEMQKRGGGSIINNASVAGIRATVDSAAYTTTKFAVVGLTKSLARDFGRDSVRCNAVCPGDIATQMNDEVLEMMARQMGVGVAELEGHATSAQLSLGRRGVANDVASVVVWLASELSGYVTGEEIRVDGGWEVGL